MPAGSAVTGIVTDHSHITRRQYNDQKECRSVHILRLVALNSVIWRQWPVQTIESEGASFSTVRWNSKASRRPADEAQSLMKLKSSYINRKGRTTPHEKAQKSQILKAVVLPFGKLLPILLKDHSERELSRIAQRWYRAIHQREAERTERCTFRSDHLKQA